MKSKDERILELRQQKEDRIAELEEKIKDIENETYILYEVIPDCGGGIADTVTQLAVSKDIGELVNYCEDTYSYSPPLSDKRPEGDKEHCKTWYKINIDQLIIL